MAEPIPAEIPTMTGRWKIRGVVSDQIGTGDFERILVALPRCGNGQVVVRMTHISLDPYLSIYMRDRIGDHPEWGEGLIRGRVIAKVIASRDARFAVGALVRGVARWQEYDVLDADGLVPVDSGPLSPTTALGILGASGLTAWVGLNLAEPKSGETLVVSSAAGPVGSVVGQLARSYGLRVIGIAGGPKKCREVVADFGFDACIDHRAEDMAQQLADAAPGGVDVLFENVGVKSLDPVLGLMNRHGRISLSGLIQHYGDPGPVSLSNFKNFLFRNIRLAGFTTSEHAHLYPQALDELKNGLLNGSISYKETVYPGFEELPASYVRMLAGEGSGKCIAAI